MKSPYYFSHPTSVSEYKNILQGGRGSPWENHSRIFRGRRGQRGFGVFGSFYDIFKSVTKPLAKAILPLAKRVGKKAAKRALEVGKDVLLEGKAPRTAIKTRGKQFLEDLVEGTPLQKGRGRSVAKRKRPKSNFDLLREDLWNQPSKKARWGKHPLPRI